MAIRQALHAAALILIAGCTMQTADVAFQTPPEHAARPVPQAMAITVTRANIDQFAVQSGNTYLVGRGDVLSIHAIDAPELTLAVGYLVESDGAIQVPFLGRVPAAGRDTGAIRSDIATRLREYLPNPQVELRVLEYNARKITVIGDVARPNRQAVTSRPLTVIDAINAAGGFATGADMRRVSVLRNGQEYGVDMDSFLQQGRELPVLRDGDVLQVGRRAARNSPPLQPESVQGVTLQLSGDGPRRFDIEGRPMTLARFMAGAGVDDGQVQVMRITDAGLQAFHFSAASAADPSVAGRFVLQDGDTVFPLTQSQGMPLV